MPGIVDEQRLIGLMGRAVIEAVEESIYNSLFMAETVVGRDNNVRYSLPVEKVLGVIRSYDPVTS
jgi:D-aminopeptidase